MLGPCIAELKIFSQGHIFPSFRSRLSRILKLLELSQLGVGDMKDRQVAVCLFAKTGDVFYSNCD